ncbi:MAG: hypothetical protein MUC38_02900 [Cyclobacteriaceae bacterium]|jgi:hypothetical protein|nr:hypothetical protein [Cyclobacteriaceae bacterium]
MKTWIKYALLNAAFGLIIGAYVAVTAIGEGYEALAVAAPLAAFVIAGLMWSLLVKQSWDSWRIALAGLFTGSVSHYLTFLFMSLGMNICYWTTGGCTGSMGEPPAGLADSLLGAFGFSFFSLLFFGWITVPYAIVSGFVLKRLGSKHKTAHQ